VRAPLLLGRAGAVRCARQGVPPLSGALTIDRWLRDRTRTTPERVAIDYLGRTVTYAELDERSDRLAAALLAEGLRRGDRVATLTGNTPEHVEAFFACAKAGLVLVPLNWRLSPAELAYQLDDAEPAVFLVEDEYEHLAAAVRMETARSVPLRRLGDVGDGKPAAEEPSDDDPLLIVYTSGTTGKPKGAVLTHANCFWTNLGFDLATGVSGDDVVLQVLPQFHCGGWNVQPLLAWWKGATVVLERSFDAARCLAQIAEKRVTTMMGVPAIYLFMAQDPAFAGADLSSLRRAVVGGAPMPESLLETWHERGVAIVQGYGLTEAAPNVLCLPPEDAVRKLGYAGKPYPYVEVALRDAEDGRLLDGPGEAELVVRGPNVFPGYWRRPEETKDAFADGWLRTGDVVERDAEGFYRIRARLKDMFISGGENVYPAEVEAVLHDHDAVVEAAVVGVPDERWGEVGVAAVVAAPGAAVAQDDLISHCRERLARYKVPKAIRFVDELPRSAMGKVLKDELRESLTREAAR
jgi:fatty-acyl-CoA synthase